jgi:hypothetical protein
MRTDWYDIRPLTTYTPERCTPAVYQEIVAGKPRTSGARAELPVSSQDCFVVEAAESDKMASSGVARLGDEELLRRAGADLVLTTLYDVDFDALAEARQEQRSR